jgi:hypothetical protein
VIRKRGGVRFTKMEVVRITKDIARCVCVRGTRPVVWMSVSKRSELPTRLTCSSAIAVLHHQSPPVAHRDLKVRAPPTWTSGPS